MSSVSRRARDLALALLFTLGACHESQPRPEPGNGEHDAGPTADDLGMPAGSSEDLGTAATADMAPLTPTRFILCRGTGGDPQWVQPLGALQYGLPYYDLAPSYNFPGAMVIRQDYQSAPGKL
jgi:hypothetical protein